MAKSLGDVLVAQGLIDGDVLEEALAQQTRDGGPLGRTLVSMGVVTEQQIVGAVARQMGVPFADCSAAAVDANAALLLPRSIAAELMALPVQFTPDNGLLVAVTDPSERRFWTAWPLPPVCAATLLWPCARTSSPPSRTSHRTLTAAPTTFPAPPVRSPTTSC